MYIPFVPLSLMFLSHPPRIILSLLSHLFSQRKKKRMNHSSRRIHSRRKVTRKEMVFSISFKDCLELWKQRVWCTEVAKEEEIEIQDEGETNFLFIFLSRIREWNLWQQKAREQKKNRDKRQTRRVKERMLNSSGTNVRLKRKECLLSLSPDMRKKRDDTRVKVCDATAGTGCGIYIAISSMKRERERESITVSFLCCIEKGQNVEDGETEN